MKKYFYILLILSFVFFLIPNLTFAQNDDFIDDPEFLEKLERVKEMKTGTNDASEAGEEIINNQGGSQVLKRTDNVIDSVFIDQEGSVQIHQSYLDRINTNFDDIQQIMKFLSVMIIIQSLLILYLFYFFFRFKQGAKRE